ncbi:Error-prone DNA polymerase [Rhizobium favelukesii]|uniref:Error-prone DNA polymerase n=1 Tax=Rhizobium favelukesii TaxID=348824 RepID=W6RWV4_9HYPH|nr:Error-prone DNA polymerase [Rhizobium favelukesii]
MSFWFDRSRAVRKVSCSSPSRTRRVRPIWSSLFEKRRRVVLGSSMMAINLKIQREGDAVHLVPQPLFDLSGGLSGLADRDTSPYRRAGETSLRMAAGRTQGTSRSLRFSRRASSSRISTTTP